MCPTSVCLVTIEHYWASSRARRSDYEADRGLYEEGEFVNRQLCILSLAGSVLLLACPVQAQQSRTGLVSIIAMQRNSPMHGGDTLYRLMLTTSAGNLHSVEASKSGGPCEGFVPGDEKIPATYTASTMTLTQGKYVCRLTIQSM